VCSHLCYNSFLHFQNCSLLPEALIGVATICPSATSASKDSKDWASLPAGDTSSVGRSSSYASHLVLRKRWCNLVIACRVREPAGNITVVSLLERKLQASATSKVDDRVVRTCFTVEVSTYIIAIQDMEVTSTNKAAKTCSHWESGTYRDLTRLAEVLIFIALTVDE